MDKTIVKIIDDLYSQIEYHGTAFFIRQDPEISDDEYDQLKLKFDNLIKDYPDEFEATGIELSAATLDLAESQLPLVELDFPMLSLRKCYSQEEYTKWADETTVGEKYLTYKLDGLGIEAHYLNGQLCRLRTRGDGTTGEDITGIMGVFNQKDLPRTLPGLEKESFIVRGEGHVTLDNLDWVNQQLPKPFKNARSAASGIVRNTRHMPEYTGVVSFNLYWSSNRFGLKRYSELMEYLSKWFSPVPRATINDIEENNRLHEEVVDGIVSVIDEFDKQDELGETNSHPRWGIAYKFPAETADTQVKRIIWETGRLGQVTPVLEYQPVVMGGNKYTLCTLFNYRKFLESGLRVGSTVTIARNGDVIPYMLEIKEIGFGKKLFPPTTCPACNAVLSVDGADEESIHLRCTNTACCPAQVVKRFLNFCDRTGFDIKGFGTKMAESLIESGVLKSFSDIFSLREKKEVFLNAYPEFTGNFIKVLDLIDKAKTISLDKFIAALGLPNVGVGTAKAIADHINGKEGILPLLSDIERLTTIDDIGWCTAKDVSTYITTMPGVKEDIENLLNIVVLEIKEGNPDAIRIGITGGFVIPRAGLSEELKKEGFELIEGVNNKIKLCLEGNKASEAKISKAVDRGIPVLDVTAIENVHELVKKMREVLNG